MQAWDLGHVHKRVTLEHQWVRHKADHNPVAGCLDERPFSVIGRREETERLAAFHRGTKVLPCVIQTTA